MKITNTQYLKIGDKTNFGAVTKIHDNKCFEADNEFSWHLDNNDVHKLDFCSNCEEWKPNIEKEYGAMLCPDCSNLYDNKTGYCSLSCCLGNGCDESC